MIGALIRCLAGYGLVVLVRGLLRWAVRTVRRPPRPPALPAVERVKTPMICLVCGTPVVMLVAGGGVVGLFEQPGFASPPSDGDVPHRCPGWAIVRWARTGRVAGNIAAAEIGREGST